MLKRNLTFFESFLTLERGLARNSVNGYVSDLNCFIDFCTANGVTEPSAVTRDLILDFLGERQDSFMEAATTQP